MTVAICIRCGEMKHGALNPCPSCRFEPEGHEDRARAMVLTDHFLAREELEEISGRIKAGEEVAYPQELIDEYTEVFAENPNLGKVPLPLKFGCVVIVLGLVWLIWKLVI